VAFFQSCRTEAQSSPAITQHASDKMTCKQCCGSLRNQSWTLLSYACFHACTSEYTGEQVRARCNAQWR
jgi:hypothetical protein